jgi:hypothetical protein
MANTFELIASSTVGSGGAASITFSSIPSTFTDLCVKLSLRSSTTDNVIMSINSSTTLFSYRLLEGDPGGSPTAASYTGTTGRIGNVVSATASTFSNLEVYIPNYAGSTNKSYSVDAVSEGNTVGTYPDLTAGLWSNTAAITALGFTLSSSNFVQYSTAYLYGVKNA